MTGPRSLPRVDWYGNELPPRGAALDALAQARFDRVVAEVAEMRSAVEWLRAAGTPFHDEVAAFVDDQALMLERENAACTDVELPHAEDTRAHHEYRDSAPRRALLIARAFLNTP